MTRPRSRIDSTSCGSRIAPPPVASTIPGRCVNSAAGQFRAAETRFALDLEDRRNRDTAARLELTIGIDKLVVQLPCSSRPTVDLPAPIMPIRNTERGSFCMLLAPSAVLGKKEPL